MSCRQMLSERSLAVAFPPGGWMNGKLAEGTSEQEAYAAIEVVPMMLHPDDY